MLSLRPLAASRVVVPLAFSTVTLVCVAVAYLTLFRGFNSYDDEGYLLVSLKGFVTGHPLYNEVYSQYGPAYYDVFGGLFALTGHPVTQDAGRLIVFVIRVVASLTAGWSMFRFTRSLPIALSGQMLTFIVLQRLNPEPMHPVGLLCLLLSLLLASAVLVFPRRPSAALAAIGAAATTAALVKVNVGAFALISVAFAACFAFLPRAHGRLYRGGVAAAFVSTPFVLMASDLGQAWVARYAFAVSAGALSLLIATLAARRRASPPAVPRRAVTWLLAGAAGAAVAECTAVLVHGTSLRELVHGAFIAPITQRSGWTQALALSAATPLVGAAGLALAVVYARRRDVLRGRLVDGLARVGAGVVLWGALAVPLVLHGRLAPVSLAIAVSLAWVAVIPPRAGDAPGFGRILIPALAVLQALHAYPVAGSQLAFSCFLFVPVGAVCLADGIASLREHAELAPLGRLTAPRLGATLGAIAVLVPLLGLGARLHGDYTTWRDASPLTFKGSTLVRVPRADAVAYERLIAGIQRRCSTFVGYPGVNSLYLWSRESPPTWANAGQWMWLLDAGQQQAVVDRLRNVGRPCVVRNTTVLTAWTSGRRIPQRPLVRYIETGFRPVSSYGQFQLMVRKN